MISYLQTHLQLPWRKPQRVCGKLPAPAAWHMADARLGCRAVSCQQRQALRRVRPSLPRRNLSCHCRQCSVPVIHTDAVAPSGARAGSRSAGGTIDRLPMPLTMLLQFSLLLLLPVLMLLPKMMCQCCRQCL